MLPKCKVRPKRIQTSVLQLLTGGFDVDSTLSKYNLARHRVGFINAHSSI